MPARSSVLRLLSRWHRAGRHVLITACGGLCLSHQYPPSLPSSRPTSQSRLPARFTSENLSGDVDVDALFLNRRSTRRLIWDAFGEGVRNIIPLPPLLPSGLDDYKYESIDPFAPSPSPAALFRRGDAARRRSLATVEQTRSSFQLFAARREEARNRLKPIARVPIRSDAR